MELLNDALEKFLKITKKPENFLKKQDDISIESKKLTKTLYDLIKSEQPHNVKSQALPELIIEDFDTEQIWQQLELQNESVMETLVDTVSRCLGSKDNLDFPTMEEEGSSDEDEGDVSNDEGAGLSEGNSDSSLEKEEEELEEVPKKKKKVNFDGSVVKSDNKKSKNMQQTIVDDKFFKLREMEQFLEKEDKKEMLGEVKKNKKVEITDEDDADSIDLFESGSSEEEEEDEEGIKYGDFFDAPENEYSENDDGLGSEHESDGDGSSISENDEMFNPKKNLFGGDKNAEPTNKSEFELRQERLQKKIQAIETQKLGEKPWQMKGEINASSRPINSLLEEVVDFDLTVRPAPVITEETSLRLEDIIKQRIKDKVFDDVERKERPTEQPNEFKKKIILDQEKSKKSLAQVYEDEYLKEKGKLLGADQEKEEPKEHKEIKAAMKSLFEKLDALSNYHYTPKPAVPDVKIIGNIPAIAMEEVAPVAVSDAALLAPEEIKAKQRGELMGKEERTDTDKKRERRKKKIHQRLKEQEKQKKDKLLDKLRPGLGNKYSREKAERTLDRLTKENKGVDKMDKMREDKSLKSSKSFFAQLQDDAETLGKKKSNRKEKLPSNKFKL